MGAMLEQNWTERQSKLASTEKYQMQNGKMTMKKEYQKQWHLSFSCEESLK